ncbi:hypothetical protein MMC13_003932 [Lambiella insularis]|nr:hypothetical protein [Lambiella insularis]
MFQENFRSLLYFAVLPRKSLTNKLQLLKSSQTNVPLLATSTGSPPTLPPSVELAYRKKCIELKRRMSEVEETNDVYRLRKVRLTRGIRKMRLERAILLETLGKRMRKHGADGVNGVYDDESEGSSEGPPTPQEKPLRSKRGHRRPAASPRSASIHRPNHPAPTPHLQPHSSFSTPIAPHPGPSPFQHTNGNTLPAHNGPSPTVAVAPVLPPPPIQPPPTVDLFVDHVITVEIPSHPQIHPQTLSAPDAHGYALSLWWQLSQSDRDEWEVRGQEVQAQWRLEMGAWEEMRKRWEGVHGDASSVWDEDMDVEMERERGRNVKEEAGEGGFTAVNN